MNNEIRDAEFEDVGETNQSPLPPEATPIVSPFVGDEKLTSFYEAVKQIVKGKKIARTSWKDKEIYGILKDSVLKLHKDDEKFYDWIISDGDLEGEDWVIIS